MKVLALTQGIEEAPTRYRVLQYQPFFNGEGCQLQVLPWPSGSREQKFLLTSLAANEVVLIQRRLPSLHVIRELRRRSRRLVFDFDDALIYSDSARGKPRLLVDRWLRFKKLVSCCDAVTAGNSYLADLASRHSRHVRVAVVPTVLALKNYERRSQPVNDCSLGWIGCRSTLPYLYSLRHVFRRLAKAYPLLKLRVICDCPPDLPEVKTEWIPWKAETEIHELQQVKVGVAPLPDDRWTRGKCALRLLQYLASGIASVASPVGTQRQIVESGGAVPATSEEQWYIAIRSLLDHPGEAKTCSDKGSQVAQQFDASHWASRVAETWCGRILLHNRHRKTVRVGAGV